MKKIFTYCGMILVFTACFQSAKGPNGITYSTVTQYNDYIVERQMDIIASLKSMAKQVGSNNALALTMLSNASTKCKQSTKEVEGMPAWKGNTNFRDKAVEMFRYYGTKYTADFKLLIDAADNPEISKAEREGLIGKGEAIDKEEEKMNEAFLAAQKEFSEANNLKLEKKQGF